VEFAIGAKRVAPLWRLLDGIAEGDWVEAIDMTGAQVTVADYRPDWWPANTYLLIRRVRLDISQVSADSPTKCLPVREPGPSASLSFPYRTGTLSYPRPVSRLSA
jgi:hypothetical protein